jgi:NAD(P)-dependent dehydrogenase (short-subunit alcohol dehydrogenase family)
MEIDGVKAIVIGGASGFARATAERIAAGGGSVAILDRPPSRRRHPLRSEVTLSSSR